MVTPGEKVVLAQQSELTAARAKTLELRKHLERTSKELAVCKQQLGASQGALHNAELALNTQQEYSRKLEQQLDRSGKGVALLKAAKLQSELGFLQKENASLFKDLQAKNQEVASLHKEVQQQKQLVEQAAKSAGLPSKQQLEDLHELKEQVISLSDSVLEKEAVIRRQRDELQELYSCQAQKSALETRLKEVQTALSTCETDKSALLDYVQEMQDREARLRIEHEAALQSIQDASRRAKTSEQQCGDLQVAAAEQGKVVAAAHKQCADLEAALKSSRAAQEELQHEHNQLQTNHLALRKQHAVMLEEVQRMQASIQGVLPGLDPHHHHQAVAEAGSPVAGHVTALRNTATTPAARDGAGDSTVQSTQLVSRLSYLSCQVQQLVAQHKQLQQAWQQCSNLQQHVDQLTEQVLDVQAHHAHSSGRADHLEEQLRVMTVQWGRCGELVNEVCACQGLKTLQYVSGREHEFVSGVERQLHQLLKLIAKSEKQCEGMTAERNDAQARLAAVQEDRERLVEQVHDTHEQLGKLAAQKDALRKECDASRAQLSSLQQELERLKRQLGSTQEELRHCRQELHSMMPADEAAALLAKTSELETRLDSAQHTALQLQAQHQSELQVLLSSKAELSREVEVLRSQISTMQQDRDQLVLRAQAVNEALVEQEQELLRMKTLARATTPQFTNPLMNKGFSKVPPPWATTTSLDAHRHTSEAGRHISPAVQLPGRMSGSAVSGWGKSARHSTPSKATRSVSPGAGGLGGGRTSPGRVSPGRASPGRASPGPRHVHSSWKAGTVGGRGRGSSGSSDDGSDGGGVRDQQRGRGHRLAARGATDTDSGLYAGGIAAAAWRIAHQHARSPGYDSSPERDAHDRPELRGGRQQAGGMRGPTLKAGSNLSQLIDKVGHLSRQALAVSQSWGTPGPKPGTGQADRVVAGGLLPLQPKPVVKPAKVDDRLSALAASYHQMRRSVN